MILYYVHGLYSVVEKKASGAISVLSISWVETLLTYQGSLLVTNTLTEEGEGYTLYTEGGGGWGRSSEEENRIEGGGVRDREEEGENRKKREI